MIILHLSDLHVCKDYPWRDEGNTRSLGTAIHEALRVEGKQPDMLLITGDFIDSIPGVEPSQLFDLCQNEINDLLTKPSFEKVQRNILFVPGNHDILRQKDNRYSQYTSFLNEIKNKRENTGKDTKHKLPKGLASDIRKHLVDYVYLDHDSHANYLIIGLNSTCFANDKLHGVGYFTTIQLDFVKKLQEHFASSRSKQGKHLITFVACHHHLAPVARVEWKAFEDDKIKSLITLDARQAIETFLDSNVSAVFHGHKHQPSFIKLENGVNNKQLAIISCGSVSAPRNQLGEVGKNSFKLYEINKGLLEIKYFTTKENNSFEFCLSNTYNCQIYKPGDSQQKCDYYVKCAEPQDTEHESIVVTPDDGQSDLSYLFFNVNDCEDARKEIQEIIDNYRKTNKFTSLRICGLYDLYGEYDTALKYRIDARESNTFCKQLVKDMGGLRLFAKGYRPYYQINITSENDGYLRNELTIPRCKDVHYENSNWNRVFLEVKLEGNMDPKDFLENLKKQISLSNSEVEKIDTNIITEINIRSNETVIFELFIPCYQFRSLSKFSRIIESIIKVKGIDKNTHIVYYNGELREKI